VLLSIIHQTLTGSTPCCQHALPVLLPNMPYQLLLLLLQATAPHSQTLLLLLGTLQVLLPLLLLLRQTAH